MLFTKKNRELLALYHESGVDVFLERAPHNRLVHSNINQCSIPPMPDAVAKNLQSNRTIEKFATITNNSMKTLNTIDAITNFDELCAAIKAFDRCDIKKTAINTVIYDGQINAKIMVIGEAPGATEDEKGIPFCGQSGKLLDNIFKSINLSRKHNIFITNAVFWRPPGNRRPTPEEIALCKPFLDKMIALIKPYLIIMVGSTAVESLLGIKSVPMNTLRTQKHSYTNKYLNGHTVETAAIFHPSYLLRQPTQKKKHVV